jgi:hypothetical protein
MLSASVPLLLLPVRLETRFFKTGLLYELRIRIYPDVVHVDSFELGLSEMELKWGEHFWEQTRAAEGDPDKLNAWAQLAQVFGPRRAAWIAKKTDPTESEPIPADPTKPHTPCTTLLPDFWIASGTAFYDENGHPDSRHFSVQGREVKYQDHSNCIYVLPRLDQPASSENIKDDPHAGWLVDFEKAEAIGMGIRVSNLPSANLRIDQLLVYGVKAFLRPDQGKTRIEALLDAHHYTHGLAFVAQGTPTNNTLSAPSGYDSGDQGSRDSFKIERQQTASENALANHRIMAKYLGINSELLINVKDSDATEQQDAREMNEVLWKETWKRFLEELLALKTPEQLQDIENMREHFTNYVRARGPLPALRIGNQPYGVLPVMALGKTGSSDAVNTRSAACLRELREIWRAALNNEELIPRLTTKDPNIGLPLLRILAMAPTGLSYVGRNSTRIVPALSEISEDGLKSSGRRPLPVHLQNALDAMLGPNTVTPHQRTVFTTHAGLCSLGYELTREDDFDPSSGDTSLFNLLRDRDKGVEGLPTLKAPVRAQLLRETLDLASHRLDAWVTSLATERLERLRENANTATGLSIGGYGWVENLVPDTEDSASLNHENFEFLHAPSLAHATTAALLRSGYLARRKKAPSSEGNQDSNAVAVNLSSDRIRLALHLVDGVRGGQSLGTLLGYRFERALHERRLDQYIPRFRDLAPGSTDLVPPGTIDDRTKAKLSHLVLDGFELVQKYRQKMIPQDLLDACQAQLKGLDDAIDAVADLVLAESVHHVAQGNHVRAGATLEAIARGETPPPELDFVRTPRTGMNHTHRIGVVFGPPSNEFPWGISTPRAQAEPALNHWVGQLLGVHAKDAICAVKYTDPTMNGEQTVLVTIKNLELAPLDLVYLFDSELGGHYSEIEQRILYHVQKDRPSINTIELEFDASQSSTPPAMGEVLEVARSLRRLVTGSRALEPRDIELPENVAEATPDLDHNLLTRATAARTAFQHAKDLLRTALPVNPETPITNPSAVWTALMALAPYGLIGAIPVIPVTQTNEADLALKRLRSQAQGVLDEATARDTRAQAMTIETTAQAIVVLKILFGEHFRILPAFTSPAENRNELEKTFTSPTLQDTTDLHSMTWFQRIARVRDGAARLDTTMHYAEALSGISLTFQIGQLPYQENEPWIALPSDTLPQHNRLSLACIFGGERNFAKPLSGLLIEEWVEVIPNKEELTGITFRYDAPQPRAPQALLLAVAPEGVTTWDESALETLLSETLELAKLRAVDLTALGELGQYLPAMYVDASRIPIDFRLPLEKGSA